MKTGEYQKEVLTILLPSGMMGDHTEEFKWDAVKILIRLFCQSILSSLLSLTTILYEIFIVHLFHRLQFVEIEAVQSPFQIYS